MGVCASRKETDARAAYRFFRRAPFLVGTGAKDDILLEFASMFAVERVSPGQVLLDIDATSVENAKFMVLAKGIVSLTLELDFASGDPLKRGQTYGASSWLVKETTGSPGGSPMGSRSASPTGPPSAAGSRSTASFFGNSVAPKPSSDRNVKLGIAAQGVCFGDTGLRGATFARYKGRRRSSTAYRRQSTTSTYVPLSGKSVRRTTTVTALEPSVLYVMQAAKFKEARKLFCNEPWWPGIEYLASCASAELVRELDFVRGVEDMPLNCLVELFEMKHVQVGEVLCREGETGDKIYVVAQGEIILSQKSPETGKSHDVAKLTSGQYIGETNLIGPEKWQATATCNPTGAVVLVLRRSRFTELAVVFPMIRHALEECIQTRQMQSCVKSMPFFAGLSTKKLELLVNTMGEVVQYRAGDRIFSQGDPGEGCYVIVQGEVTVTRKEVAAKTEEVLAVLGTEAYFGELALITNKPRAATCVASGEIDTIVLTFDKSAFDTLMSTGGARADFELRVLGRDASLLNVLRHSKGLQLFTEHMESEHSPENINFWRECVRYKKLFDVERGTEQGEEVYVLATQVLADYVENDSDSWVNLKGTVVQQIRKQVGEKKLDLLTFHQAEKEIFRLMEKDNFERFKKGPKFAALLESISSYTDVRGGLGDVSTGSYTTATFSPGSTRLLSADSPGSPRSKRPSRT